MSPAEDDSPSAGVIAVVGEALMDLVPAADGLFEAAPGGSPANVAVGLARLDVPVRMLARLADDVLGRRLRAHLDTNGVDLSRAVAASEPSSLAIVALDSDGVAQYDFRVQGTADWQWRDDELAGSLEGVCTLHAGSLALTMAPGAQVLARLMADARSTATVSYDPNCRPLLMGDPQDVRARVEAIVAVADVVKASAEDLAWLYPGVPAPEVLADWLGRGPALVAVTLGPDGVVAGCQRGDLLRLPGRPVDVVDTVGAGDAFMAGMLAGLHRRQLLGAGRRDQLRDIAADIAADVVAEVMGEALTVAALTCTRRGADPPTAAELADAQP